MAPSFLATGGAGAGWVLAGVAVVCLLEDSVGLGAVLPAETVVVSAAAAAAHGVLPLWPVFAVAWLCGVAGDAVGFGIGRHWGPGLLERYGARFGLTPERAERAEGLMARWGPWGVAGGRLIPAVRILVMPVAGASCMTWRRFLPADVAGVATWAGLHVTVGYLVGVGIERADLRWRLVLLAGAAAVALVLVAAVLVRRTRSHGRPDEAPPVRAGG